MSTSNSGFPLVSFKIIRHNNRCHLKKTRPGTMVSSLLAFNLAKPYNQSHCAFDPLVWALKRRVPRTPMLAAPFGANNSHQFGFSADQRSQQSSIASRIKLWELFMEFPDLADLLFS